ncbi:hypothetical protein SAMN05216302_101158 [Nitrosomonas aestuarii]|uniref:Uncharacterized protein n=1 Tax=Nitrosomonas aestuarii TaxID=52441 RepID=A0A1I4B623_9PROT|nr:hypothetical protein SAMN05216302_101158 [Nitrosomonas aestuarii]
MESEIEKLEHLLLIKRLQLSAAENARLSKIYVESLRKEICALNKLLKRVKRTNS